MKNCCLNNWEQCQSKISMIKLSDTRSQLSITRSQLSITRKQHCFTSMTFNWHFSHLSHKDNIIVICKFLKNLLIFHELEVVNIKNITTFFYNKYIDKEPYFSFLFLSSKVYSISSDFFGLHNKLIMLYMVQHTTNNMTIYLKVVTIK